jgi:sugar phosphate permease
VVAHTSHLTYVTEYEIAGISGLVMSVIGIFTVRELTPALRAQTLVTEEDGDIVSARVRQGEVDDRDAERHLAGRWGQIVRNPYIWGMAFGSNVFLLYYIIATGFSTVYYTSVLHFSLATANGINTFFFGIACASNVVFGIVADRVRVRKPVYLAGWAIALIFAILFALERHPSYAVVTTTVSIMVAAMAMSTTQYYAALSERLEHINPMAVAAGFGLANVVARAVQGAFLLIFPHLVGADYTNRNGWDISFWTSIVCIAVALPLVLPGILGRWNPRAAMAEVRQHKSRARVELSSLEAEPAPAPGRTDTGSSTGDPATTTSGQRPG